MDTNTEQPAPYGRHYNVNGHDLLLHRTGAGDATVVLTAMDVDPFKRAVSMGVSEDALQAEIDGKARLYDELAASFTRGENRRIEGVGHVTLLMRRPDVVVEAVRDVIGQSLPVSP
jgi:hypothetical protein